MKKMMKKLASLAIVLGFAFGFTTAMASSGQGNWTHTFKLVGGHTITHTPSAVLFDGQILGNGESGPSSETDLQPLLQLLGPVIIPGIVLLCKLLTLRPAETYDQFVASLVCAGLLYPSSNSNGGGSD